VKVLLVIDHFGSGGAQRQIVELACGLVRRGHSVEMFVYFPQHDFFWPRLKEHRILVHEEEKRSGGSIAVVRKLASLVRIGHFDAVVSYLSTANVYAELSILAARNTQLVVSERTSACDDRSAIGAALRRFLHVFADRVVANSVTHATWLRRRHWLRRKVSCIYNGVDLSMFQPNEAPSDIDREVRLCAIGRIGPEKNLLNLISALAHVHKELGYVPAVSWAGPRDASATGQRYCREVDTLLESLPEVRRRWNWLGVQSDIPELLRRHDALIHPSFYEGLPNVVCEALATGLPVLVSNVCDHPLLVADGERGFLFDPRDPASIAAAIVKLLSLDRVDRLTYASNARKYAEANLGMENMIGAYEDLLKQLVGHHGAH
jgi:glycosyltransferase involved in cell wall biosynthesis